MLLAFQLDSYSGILNDIFPDSLSGILSDVASDIYSDLLCSLCFDILSDTYFDIILIDMCSDNLSCILSDILMTYSNILPDILSCDRVGCMHAQLHPVLVIESGSMHARLHPEWARVDSSSWVPRARARGPMVPKFKSRRAGRGVGLGETDKRRGEEKELYLSQVLETLIWEAGEKVQVSFSEGTTCVKRLNWLHLSEKAAQ